MHPTTTLLLAVSGIASAADLSRLPSYLQEASASTFPALKDIAVEIYHDPEVGLDETHAHDLIVEHFQDVTNWHVTPHSFNLATAFRAVYEHRPDGYDGDLPTVGVLAEYDALLGIGHACGHHLIALNGMNAASLVSQALVKYDIPGRVILQGCPDEENAAGKFHLNKAGAFNASDIWVMAHPTSSSAVQPMNARLNYFASFLGATHQDAVKKAYKALVIVQDLSGHLPGTASSVSSIENVGAYATNIVQTFISLGVAGSNLGGVNKTVASLLDSKYPGVQYQVYEDQDGVAINVTGPGGHASESSKGPLVLTIETFRMLSQDSSLSFYLPGNTTAKELDITVDMRTRYTADLPKVADAVTGALGSIADNVSHDVKYPSLEVVPYMAKAFVSLISTEPYGLQGWKVTDFAPASTDASWLEGAYLDPDTHELLSVGRVVTHYNYGICGPNAGDICAFNHEPKFAEVAGTDFAYQQTEIVSRAQAQILVELLANADMMKDATSLVRK